MERKSKYSSVIIEGEFVPYDTEDTSIIAYLRILGEKELLVIRNYQSKKGTIRIPDGFKERVLGNREERNNVDGKYCLEPYECIALYREKSK